MSNINHDQLIARFPEFNSYDFTPEQLTAFKLWIPVVSEAFQPSEVSGSDEMLLHIKCLYVAHLALLTWLPRNGLSPAIVLGDNSGQTASEGKISVSYSRIGYAQFLNDPFLSLTMYGSELAHYLRQGGGSSTRIL